MNLAKRVFSIIMVLITLVSIMSVSAEALTVVVKEDPDSNYGYMVPVNYNGTETVSTVKVYGEYDYINFYIKAYQNKTRYFFYAIYSDKNLTKCVESDCIEIDGKGSYSFNLELKLKGKYKTKTYYVVTYAAAYSEKSDKMTIDAESMRQFKLDVNRTTSFSKQKVMLKEIKNTTKGAYIKWSALSGTNKYDIYRRSITGTKWTKVGSVSKSKTSFTDTSVKSKNANYIYTVKAVNKKGTVSRYHYAGLTCLFASTPVMESVNVIYNNTIELKWNKTSSKAKYNIMRKEDGGDWETIKSSYSSTTYKDKTAENGKKYTYSVKAVISTDYGKAVSSYYANDSKAITFFKAPSLNDVALTEAGVKVEWNEVSGVNGYTVMRRPLDKSEGWTEVGVVDSTILEFTDTTADLEKAYIYTVRSLGESFNGSYYSAGIEFVVLDEPTDVRHSYASSVDGIKLSWQDVEYADQYNIYLMDENGQWKLLQEIEDTFDSTCYKSFVPEKIGITKYSITALRDGSNETAIGENIYEVKFFPSVDVTIAEIRKDGNLLRWKDKGAQKYNVYRSVGEDAEYELYQVIDVAQKGETISFIDPQTDAGVYKYSVKGVYDGMEQDVYHDVETLSRASEEGLVRNENVVFYRNRAAKTIKFGEYTEDYEKEYYVYNYKTDAWKEFSPYKNDGRVYEYIQDSMPNKDGEYTFAVVYIIDGAKTPIDSVTYTGTFWDYSFEDVSVKSVENAIRVSWDEVDGAVKYIIHYSLEGSNEITEAEEIPISETGKYKFDFERDQSDVNRVSFRIEAVDADGRITAVSKSVTAEANPVMYGAVRKDNGEVWVYWNYYWQGQDYIVMRKTEGGSWKKVDKDCNPFHAKTYKGKECAWYVDKNAKEGVKYTYTVISKGEGDINDYLFIDSYYDTEGVTCKG